MKYFHLDGRIVEELLNRFLGFMNETPSEEITIIINSVGGKECVSKLILNIINENKERCTLISLGVYSAAFYIFYNAECKRKMTYGSPAMWHLSSADMRMMSNKKPSYTEDETQLKNWVDDKIEIEFAEKFMTPKELRDFKKGIDVYFTFKRIKEIFPDVEII
jgi:ATP-dependent protease ClpP protease subunit